MTALIPAIVVLIGTLVAGEYVLWRLFRRRIDPVTFPHERDRSQMGFFGVGKMRLVAVAHTLILGIWIICSLVWLW